MKPKKRASIETKMDNPNIVLDEEDGSEEELTETIRLRPYYDWRVCFIFQLRPLFF